MGLGDKQQPKLRHSKKTEGCYLYACFDGQLGGVSVRPNSTPLAQAITQETNLSMEEEIVVLYNMPVICLRNNEMQ